MTATHIGNNDTSTLYIPETYLIPNLTFDLISVGRLCDFDLDLHFSNHYGCIVQDPRTGQKVGTGRKTGTPFKLESLKVPHHFITNTTLDSKSFPLPKIYGTID